MDHFLTKIIKSNGVDLSKDKSVHIRFVRYSKGIFDGPALKITRKGKSIAIKASLDYENILGFLVASLMHADTVELEGNITTFEDPAPMMEIAIPAGKQGQVLVNEKKATWVLTFSGSWTKTELLKIHTAFDQLRGYILLSMASGGDTSTSFEVKDKIPQPKKSTGSKKVGTDEEADMDKIAKAIKFCTAKFSNEPTIAKEVLDVLVPDMKQDASNFKEIVIENNYTISDISIPANAKDKRLEAIRKGILSRKVAIDGKAREQTYPFMV